MSDCNGSCEGCGSADNCGGPESLKAAVNPNSKIRQVIGVVSGKGGVGKSLVTGLLANAIRKTGREAAIMDADITGPSIPKMFGLHDRAAASDLGLNPVESESGIKIMSLNLLVENDTDPVIWRGPVIAGVVKQFWTDVVWGEVDTMMVDMPPGTGDVPLTVFQSLPLSGIVIVTSPQDLVSMVVTKAINMAKTMNVPVLGIVENYSYYKCPDCGSEHRLYGPGVQQIEGIPVLDRIPIDPDIATLCDAGEIEQVAENYLPNTLEKLGF